MAQKEEDLKLINALEKVISKAKGRVTPAELSAETGFTLDQVKTSLNALLERYSCKVKMDNSSGKLVFEFDYPLSRRDKKTIQEYFYEVLDFLYKIFKVIYKASIGFVLIAYTVLFAIILIAMTMKSDDDDDSGAGFSLIGGLLRAVFESMQFAAMANMMTQYNTGDDGYRYKQFVPEKNKGKGFIKSVYDFVFGPERPAFDPLSDIREAISFIRSNSGKISSANIIALTGADYPAADSRLAEYAGKFGGELYIDSDGIVIAEFHEMLERVNSDLKGGKIEYYKNEIEPPYFFTGNTNGKNISIALMNAFNLTMSFVFLNMFKDNLLLGILLGIFPFIVSILYFVIPLLRIPSFFAKRTKRNKSVLRKKLIGFITDFSDQQFRFSDFKRFAGNEYSDNEIQKMIEQICRELEGEVILTNNNEAVYVFERLNKEMKHS